MTLDEKLAKLEWNDYLGPPPSYNTLDALFRVCKSQGWYVSTTLYAGGNCQVYVYIIKDNKGIWKFGKGDNPVQALRNALEEVVG